MQIEEIASKILRQTQDTLSILYGKNVVVAMDFPTRYKQESVFSAIEKVFGYNRFTYRIGKGNEYESMSKHLLMFYLSQYANLSEREISKILKVERSTVVYGIKKVIGFVEIKDDKTRVYMAQIEKILGS